jgi:N-carbamoyl-L-amino-acid hydrolase
VQDGGRFDGILGVVAALEVARCLRAAGHRLARPLEVVSFTCEEPSEFGLSTIGSRAMSGKLDAARAAALRDAGGRTLAEAIASVGGAPERLDSARRAPGSVARYLELHIEQAPSLEEAGVPVGIVTVIAAPSRFRVRVSGRADHAGGTAMAARRDALAAAAEIVLAVERLARAAGPELVGTVGALAARPGMVNVVPGEAELLADFRGTEDGAIEAVLAGFEAACADVAARRGVAVALEPLLRERPLQVAPEMVQVATEAAAALGLPHRHLASRASHDANHLAALCPVGLLFVPCREGRSHCPEEWAEPAHVEAGTRLLLETVLRLDAALPVSAPPGRALAAGGDG